VAAQDVFVGMPSNGDGDPAAHCPLPAAYRLRERAKPRLLTTPCDDATE